MTEMIGKLHMNIFRHSFSIFLSSVISFSGFASGNDLAPTSQPSQKNGIKISCNEWVLQLGKEGKCTVDTETTQWEISYYREGEEKRTLKNKIKNLIVIFHPSGNDHKIFDWWSDMVGKGKAIDTT